MTAHIRQIWRHPIKAHGVEALAQVALTANQTMPWDRRWAVVHEASQADGTRWMPCRNFSRGAKAPSLMAISAVLDEAGERITLTHPDLAPITFAPDHDGEEFLTWVRPLMPADRPTSTGIVRAMDQGMTDSDFPSISLNNLASNAAVGAALGQDLSPLRWRGNLWFDGLEPWEEFNWIGKRVAIGTAELKIVERITRCMAPTANPATGRRDAATLEALNNNWGHQDFGVCGVVTVSGTISSGDKVKVL